MPLTPRTFRNTDVSSICEVWNSHYEGQDPTWRIDPLRLEIFALAKPYFDAKQLWVVELEGRVEGFIHCGPAASEDLNDQASEPIGISAFCVRSGEREDEIAAALLAAVSEYANERDIKECVFKPTIPNTAFYLGLGPGDSLAGAVQSDVRTCKWLSDAGFEPAYPTSVWELEVVSFQARVDRQMIQIRRASQVSREVDEPQFAWWQACVLGHTEPAAFQLAHRAERRLMCEVLFWTLAPELHSTPSSVAWLWPPVLAEENAPLVFLLSEAIRGLQSDRVDLVRAVSLADDSSATDVLRTVGFTPTISGMVFSKRF